MHISLGQCFGCSAAWAFFGAWCCPHVQYGVTCCLKPVIASTYTVFASGNCSLTSASIPFKTSRSMRSANLLNSDRADC